MSLATLMARAAVNAMADELSNNAVAFGKGMVSCFFFESCMIEETVRRLPFGTVWSDHGFAQSSARRTVAWSRQSSSAGSEGGARGFMKPNVIYTAKPAVYKWRCGLNWTFHTPKSGLQSTFQMNVLYFHAVYLSF
jgi:hypothetical protein